MERFGYRRILLALPLVLANAGAAVALSACGAGGAPLGAAAADAPVSPSPQLDSSGPVEPTPPASAAANSSPEPEVIIPTAGPAALQVSSGTTHTVTGEIVTAELHCSGGDVVVEGTGNTVKISGVCTSISVMGNSNTVQASDAASIHIDGVGNFLTGGTFENVTILSGPNSMHNRSTGVLTMEGQGNGVKTGPLKNANVSGTSNSARYAGGAPITSVTGIGNSVSPH
ncbi:DUF3060 domain-containing protein [Paenarthrobacter sp. CM16]|uniref:DUF3060 domain-containing protein n=1 Tax=Paenarthrobacter sp. CM16 TaxID=2738447 RepID=UPI001552A27C|nr:DUF3060 domain-containing protein [Paenarthrobacter sp. CM16]NQD89096.1 DUF3060 domain-containing protein [Paenarthrobacter sp. CM16]